jgi:hypothetical protein
MSVGAGRQNVICNFVSEITVTFLGIHKRELAVYIGFSAAQPFILDSLRPFICSRGVKNTRHKSVDVSSDKAVTRLM